MSSRPLRPRSLNLVTAPLWVCGMLVAVMMLHDGLLAAPTFKSIWSAPGVSGVSFAGKKVAALVIADDLNVEMSGEEALARELAAVGTSNPIAAYRMMPRELVRDAKEAKAWFERTGVEGVVVLRVVSAETEKIYTPAYWNTTNYSTLWSYYGYGWSSVYVPGKQSRETTVIIENLVFSVPMNKLLWAAVSESTNPKNAGALIRDLVKETMKEMRKVNLIR